MKHYRLQVVQKESTVIVRSDRAGGATSATAMLVRAPAFR